MEGLIIDGYEIIKYVGRGQFGTVYVCRKDSKEYAMKIFNLEYVASEYSMHGENNRIKNEIEALKRVKHKNTINYIDDGTFDNNNQTYIYVIMEQAKGVELKEYINKNVLSVDDTIVIINQILDALDCMHKNNIIHRDLKPQNIFIDEDKKIKVLDYGLSKIIDFTSITSTGDTIGSPIYMSPEQVVDSKHIDYRSDYYSLGVILFELLSRKYPYSANNRNELFYKIINEKPISILQYVPEIPNYIDNLIISLMEKDVYKRPDTIEKIKEMLKSNNIITENVEKISPSFYLRLYNESTIMKEFYKDGNSIENAIFPINLQTNQKNVLKQLSTNKINHIFDPSTIRLTYDTFSDVKGLVELPYAPSGYDKYEIRDFESIEKKREYVKNVVEEQLKYDSDYILAPFHASNNSNFVSIKGDSLDTWFTLDVKLLKETKDYMIQNKINRKLVMGVCVKKDILTTASEREYLLNVLTSLPVDMYIVYVDTIDYNSNVSEIYNYMLTLLKLQKFSNKPVIAGRINSAFGLVLLSLGLYAFESGASRFESYYEELYSEKSNPYNMYVTYYIPELLKVVSISRKDPSKLVGIFDSEVGNDLKCNCPYCKGKKIEEILQEKNCRLHFLYNRNKEIDYLRNLDKNERLNYITGYIDNAISYYQKLNPVFKANDWEYLKKLQKVVPDLAKDLE